jgi:putative ABC transport system permease protein
MVNKVIKDLIFALGWDSWSDIIQTIKNNKLRTALTACSVAWGIFILIILLGAGNGLENAARQDFSDAINSIWIGGGKTKIKHDGYNIGRKIELRNEDFDHINSTVDAIASLSSSITINSQILIINDKRQDKASLQAIHPDHQVISNTEIVEGRRLNRSDFVDKRKVAIIGDKVKETLFKEESPIGKFIKIDNIFFKVVGVYTDFFDSERQKVYIPISVGQMVFSGKDNIELVAFSIKEPNALNSRRTIAQVKKLLATKYGFEESDEGALWVNNNIEEFDKFQNLFGNIKAFIWIVGIGSLIAGIMGVGNIMYISVNERTREIGIRKAIGASPFSILRLILLESLLITLIAGYVGMFFGLIVVDNLQNLGIETVKNPAVDFATTAWATGIIIFCGILAGGYPAVRAARLKPSLTMREE